MSTKDYSAELLKMEGVQIEKLDETEEEIILQISMERKIHICKRCGGKTDRIHDYRVREVRDLELRGKPVRLLYRRRRYACPACGKRFSETNEGQSQILCKLQMRHEQSRIIHCARQRIYPTAALCAV